MTPNVGNARRDTNFGGFAAGASAEALINTPDEEQSRHPLLVMFRSHGSRPSGGFAAVNLVGDNSSDDSVTLAVQAAMMIAMREVTRILWASEQGDPSVAQPLLPLVYDELRRLAARKLAQEKPGHTIQATALLSSRRP
jgi:hypothetical protein